MPLVGYRCPSWVPTAGTENDVYFCLSKCPHPCVAPPLLAAMYQSDSENHHVGTYISSSMLAGSECPRQTVYERKFDFYEVPKRRFWPFRGTHAHSIVEGAASMIAPLGWMQEMRMAVDFTYPDLAMPILRNGKFTGRYNEKKPLVITVGGTTDCYNPWKKEMWDMKSAKDEKAKYMITGKRPKWFTDDRNSTDPHLEDSWIKQLNVYRLLVSKTRIPDDTRAALKLSGDFFPAPEFLGIQCISMMEIPRTGAPYSIKHQVQVGHKWVEETFNISNIPVWPLADTEQFVRQEALKWFNWLVLDAPTPVVDESKAKWLCSSCPFNGEIIANGPCHPASERAGIPPMANGA